MQKQFTKKAFRELLNSQQEKYKSTNHKNGVYHQLKRLYGDYLYHQDREKFDVNYKEWLVENGIAYKK